MQETEAEISYSEERGTCPTCGSGQVTHVQFGLFMGDAGSLPEWVDLGGCEIPEEPHDRICQSCGHSWYAPDTPWRSPQQ
jgi:hypothetical protein